MELPLDNAYWVLPGRLLAGEHPIVDDVAVSHERLHRLVNAGLTTFIDLTEADEQPNYRRMLPRSAEYVRHAIVDKGIPVEVAQMRRIQEQIRDALQRERGVYLHCRAGIGRTGTVIGCFLVEEGHEGKEALRRLNLLWRQSARSDSFPKVPQTVEQADYVRQWSRWRTR